MFSHTCMYTHTQIAHTQTHITLYTYSYTYLEDYGIMPALYTYNVSCQKFCSHIPSVHVCTYIVQM